MNHVYLLLGSNEGNRVQWLQSAINGLHRFATLEKQSAVYETAAWGLESQPNFLNMVIEIKTSLSAPELLVEIQQLETELERQRTIVWGPRTLDIDILFFNDEIIQTDHLIVPHPGIPVRRFTLEPLCEIAPHFLHPSYGKTVQQLLDYCTDHLETKRLGMINAIVSTG
ncbi:MAG: 2-amino-4-hydroxy-6-hydroxymethyldihydropteridine diphosphokinase [Bacteroidetes bacterium]|nr:2-amino-4-hydroxy-6-hydroxymethyldihydropteridine diphosphokinase [Bacteroidota bacterium]MBS1739093.1 2-amino-4-hydroxy-6-hydroxymethyldihydropteridine diphosphokinase [Bacteroidota bacterium]